MSRNWQRLIGILAGVLVVAALVVWDRMLPPVPVPIPAPEPREMTVFLTGYSFWDNTPPASKVIARGVLRDKAGGTGTYHDPTTLAVGHVIVNGEHIMDYPAGTMFYLPRIRQYAIVEDMCGDGPTPHLVPCHIGWEGYPWVDIYVGGTELSPEQATRCAEKITAVQEAIMHPRRGLPVEAGELAATICVDEAWPPAWDASWQHNQ